MQTLYPGLTVMWKNCGDLRAANCNLIGWNLFDAKDPPTRGRDYEFGERIRLVTVEEGGRRSREVTFRAEEANYEEEEEDNGEGRT